MMNITDVSGFYGEMKMVQMGKPLLSVVVLVDVHSLEAIEMEHAFLSHPVKMLLKGSIQLLLGSKNGNNLRHLFMLCLVLLSNMFCFSSRIFEGDKDYGYGQSILHEGSLVFHTPPYGSQDVTLYDPSCYSRVNPQGSSGLTPKVQAFLFFFML